MNQPSREQIEARLTALLLGELPADEAELLRFTIAQDAALKKLHDELAATIVLVREAEKSPADAAAEKNAALKFSEARRKKLLAHFQTPRKADPLFWLKPIKIPSVQPLVITAFVVLLFVGIGAIMAPNFIRSRSTSQASAVMNNGRQIDAAKNQWALENQKSADAIPTAAPAAKAEGHFELSQESAALPAVASAAPLLAPVAPPVSQIVLPAAEPAEQSAAATGLPSGGRAGGVYSQGVVGYVNTPINSGEVKALPRGTGGGGKISENLFADTAPAAPQPEPKTVALGVVNNGTINGDAGVARQNVAGNYGLVTGAGEISATSTSTVEGRVAATRSPGAGAKDVDSFSGGTFGGRSNGGGVGGGGAGGTPASDGSVLAQNDFAVNRSLAENAPQNVGDELRANPPTVAPTMAPTLNVSGNISDLSAVQTQKELPALALNGNLSARDQEHEELSKVPAKTVAPARRELVAEKKSEPAAGFEMALNDGKKSEDAAATRFYRQRAAGEANPVQYEKKYFTTKVTKLPAARADGDSVALDSVAGAAEVARRADEPGLSENASVDRRIVNGVVTTTAGRPVEAPAPAQKPAAHFFAGSNFSVQPAPTGAAGATGEKLEFANKLGVVANGGTAPQVAISGGNFKLSDANTFSGTTTVDTGTLGAEKNKDSFATGLTKEDVAGLRYLTATNAVVLSGNFSKILGPLPAAGTAVAEMDRQLMDRPLPKSAPSAPIPQPEILCRENNFSTFSLNVSDVSFKLAAASLERGQMPDAAAIRSEEFINAFDYRDPEAAAGQPLAFVSERARYPFAHNRELLRFSVKTAAAGRPAGRALNLVLLLDNSGSMERADRVAIIREALRVLATQLQPQDTVSVVTFARTARLWADGVSGDTAGAVLARVGGITPEGGTNLEEAMRLAYETARRHYLANGMNRVVLLTDGAANLGDVNPADLKQKVEAQRKQGIALDCFGIGFEDFNDDLLEQLSRNGDGRYAFINTAEDAGKEFAAKLAGALQVAASDVKVQVEFNPQRVISYRQIGYAKHQLTKEQFRDNTVDAAEIAAQEAGNALYTVETKADGIGPIATVRVRYKVPGTTDYRERSWDVAYEGNAVPLEQSSAAMKLAATASAFSEWLATSPFAQEVTPDELLKTMSGVPQIYGADERPKKLEWMIRQAKSLSGK